MTATLALPRLARHPAWYAPLLLPVLPLLGTWLTDAAPFTGSRAACTLLLLTLGLLLSVGIPALLDHLPASVRKEANLLRDAWILGLFPAQLPLLADPAAGLVGLELMFFAVSCALLASLPLGLEFQQRTLAGLLSQPIARAESWNLKSRLLAVALALQTLVFLVSAGAQDRRFTPMFVLGAVAIAATAWGTTPWWTLLTRGLLPGLAFSLAVPLLLIGLGSAVLQFLATAGPYGSQLPDYGDLPGYLLLLGIAPLYTLLGAFAGVRRWHRLEAPDSGGSDGVLLGTARREGTAGATLRRLPLWRLLLAQETRLQAVTLILLGVSLLLLLLLNALSASPETYPNARGLVLGLFALAAMTTLVLAGATPIAEERRLGTLDAQLLLPISRGTVWWTKLAVGGAITAGVAFLMWRAFAPASDHPQGFPWPEAAQLAFLCLGTFAFAFLASSTAPHPLRAVLASLAILAAIGCLLGAAVGAGAELADRASREAYASAYSDAARWTAEAESLNPDEALDLYRRTETSLLGGALSVPVFALLNGLPILGALLFAHRNFSRADASERRLPVQVAACLGAFTVLAAVALGMTHSAARERAHADTLVNVRAFVEVSRTFSPADRMLWETFHRDPYSTFVPVPLEPRPGLDPRTDPAGFALPLNPKSRRLLLHRGKISDDLRALLREEGTRKGEDLSPPPPEPPARPSLRPSPAPKPGAPLPPGLRARYGLLPAPPSPTPPPNP
jgi:hypothetical protein